MYINKNILHINVEFSKQTHLSFLFRSQTVKSRHLQSTMKNTKTDLQKRHSFNAGAKLTTHMSIWGQQTVTLQDVSECVLLTGASASAQSCSTNQMSHSSEPKQSNDSLLARGLPLALTHTHTHTKRTAQCVKYTHHLNNYNKT